MRLYCTYIITIVLYRYVATCFQKVEGQLGHGFLKNESEKIYFLPNPNKIRSHSKPSSYLDMLILKLFTFKVYLHMLSFIGYTFESIKRLKIHYIKSDIFTKHLLLQYNHVSSLSRSTHGHLTTLSHLVALCLLENCFLP